MWQPATAPRPVHSDLYEENSTAWMMSVQVRLDIYCLFIEPNSSTLQEKIVSDTERLCQLVVNCTQSALDWASQYVDLDYILFIKWLLSPVILTFVILPAVILVLIYVSSLVLYIYQVHYSGTSDDR